MKNISITKLFIFIVLISIFIFCISIVKNQKTHQDRIGKMYEFAGQDYSDDLKSAVVLGTKNPFLKWFGDGYLPKGAIINSFVLSKEMMLKAGLSEQCGDVVPLKLFGEPNIYKNDESLCCESVGISLDIPLVLDAQGDRVLLLCGMADTSYVASISADNMNKIFEQFKLKEYFDVRIEMKIP